jgi:prevent-host-death family protein
MTVCGLANRRRVTPRSAPASTRPPVRCPLQPVSPWSQFGPNESVIVIPAFLSQVPNPSWVGYVLPCNSMSNMVGIRELRQQTSSVMKRVLAGETIEITEHGHPIARIIPLRPGPLEQLALAGGVTLAEADLLDQLSEMSLPAPPTDSVLPSQSLLELRAEED